MSIGSFAREIYSVQSISKVTGLESKHITGRKWQAYELNLGIRAEALNGEKVLNFGSGSSYLEKDLKKKNINCDVVELDLKYDPWQHDENDFNIAASIPVNLFSLYTKFFNNPENQNKLVQLKRKVAGTEGRIFVQANGRVLPFPDRAFGYVLSFATIHQLPLDAKEKVFRELMRVGDILHLASIYNTEYELLSRLAPELGFEIVACAPLPQNENEPISPKFDSPQSYDSFMLKDEGERIRKPTDREPKVQTILGNKTIIGDIGNMIVMRRKK